MDFSKIEEVLDTDKKSSASREKKETYVTLMVEILNDQGLTNKSVDYLRRGFAFAGAKPIIKYLSGLDKDAAGTKIEQLFKCDLFKAKDRVTGFRLCTSLMGYALEEFDIDRKILKKCILFMPGTSKKKDGGLLSEAPKLVETNMIALVSDGTELPALNTLGMKDIFIDEFKAMMLKILGKVQNVPSNRIDKFMLWVDPTRQVRLPENAEKISEDLQPVVSVTNDKKADLAEQGGEDRKNTENEVPAVENTRGEIDDKCSCETEETVTSKPADEDQKDVPCGTEPVISSASGDDMSGKDKKSVATKQKAADNKLPPVKNATTVSGAEMVQGATLMFNLAERMMAWATNIEEMAGGNRKLTQDNDDLSKEIKHLRAELELEKRKCFDAKAEIVEDTRTIADLKAQLSDVRRDNAELKAQSITTQDELARLNAILSVYSADKENAQKEQLNSIAAKLKAEYRDFKDAENDDMTIDLGENFRFQLAQIFKILVKAGIDVEKR